MRSRLLVAAVLLLMFAVPLVAQAQSVAINPTTVEFVASTDHAALSLDNTPMVVRYELRIYTEATTLGDAVVTQDLGKPTPAQGSNLITVINPVWFAGLTPRTRYVAKVTAIGASGEGSSTVSNPFGNVPPPAGPTAVVLRR